MPLKPETILKEIEKKGVQKVANRYHLTVEILRQIQREKNEAERFRLLNSGNGVPSTHHSGNVEGKRSHEWSLKGRGAMRPKY